jgi:hypothetical protein
MVFVWQAEGLPPGHVQMDFVFGERLWTLPQAVEIPLLSGGSALVQAASQELSLAWKLVWLETDMYPQGKDLYDATLLAQQTPLRLDILKSALEAADTLLDLLNGERVSAEGAQEWVTRGLSVLDRNREVGRGYFRLGSKYSLEVLEELREGLALKQVARVLKLYATALCGRDVAIRSTQEMYAIEAFGSDHVVLPPDMRFFDDDDANFTAYKVATAHGAGRIEFGTYDFHLDDLGEVVDHLVARYGGPR